MKIIVLHNQSIFDLALQYTGAAESVFELALANGISITDDLKAGQAFEVTDNIQKNNDILNYYQAKKIQPATGFSIEDKQVLEQQEGISIWAISTDFVVSKNE